MKKELLLGLLLKLKNNPTLLKDTTELIGTNEGNELERLLYLNDSQISDVLEEENFKSMACKIFLYLNGDIDEEIKTAALANLESSPINVFYGLNRLKNKRPFFDENINDIIKIIINSKGKHQAEEAYLASFNDGLLSRSDALEIIDIIAKCDRDYQAKQVHFAACDEDLLESDYYKDLIKIISTANGRVQAATARTVAVDSFAMKAPYVKDIVSLFANAKQDSYVVQAQELVLWAATEDINVDMVNIVGKIINAKCQQAAVNACAVAKTKISNEEKDITELIDIVASSIGKVQASTVADLLLDDNFPVQEDTKELLRLIASAKEGYQASCAAKFLNSNSFKEMLKDEKLTNQGTPLKILNLITNTTGEKTCDCVATLAATHSVLKNEKGYSYLEKVASSLSSVHAECAKAALLTEDFLEHPSSSSVIDFILSCKNMFALRSIENIAGSTPILFREDCLDIFEYISQLNEKSQLNRVTVITKELCNRGQKDLLEVIKDEHNIKSDLAAKNIVKSCKKEKPSEEECYVTYNKSVSEVMSGDSLDTLIKGLQESEADEVNSNTVIKVRKKILSYSTK